MGKGRRQPLMRVVLLMLFPLLPMQAHTQESEQLSTSVQEKRDQRQRLRRSPGEWQALAMGEITVERLNGLCFFSTPSKAIVNRCKLTKLHEDGPILY